MRMRSVLRETCLQLWTTLERRGVSLRSFLHGSNMFSRWNLESCDLFLPMQTVSSQTEYPDSGRRKCTPMLIVLYVYLQVCAEKRNLMRKQTKNVGALPVSIPPFIFRFIIPNDKWCEWRSITRFIWEKTNETCTASWPYSIERLTKSHFFKVYNSHINFILTTHHECIDRVTFRRANSRDHSKTLPNFV